MCPKAYKIGTSKEPAQFKIHTHPPAPPPSSESQFKEGLGKNPLCMSGLNSVF